MIRDRIEAGFERWGSFVFRHAGAAIAATALLVAGLASQLPKLVVDGSDEAFLHETDPARVTYDAFRAQFERSEMIVIAVRPPEVFDLGFLAKLRAFHEDLEDNVPQLNDVTSLVNARYTHGVEDELIVEDLLEDWPEDAADVAALRERVLAHPLYRNLYISEDGRLAAVLIELDTYSSLGAGAEDLSGFEDPGESEVRGSRPFLTGEEVFAVVGAVSEVVARHDAPDFRLYMTGGAATEAMLMTAMQRDMTLFVSLAVLIIVLFLFVLFRRLSGVLLPLAVVALALLCTIATMAMTGVPVTLPIQVLPSFLLAVGVGASVHVLTLFYRELRRGAGREEAIAHSLGHSGLAIAMTSLTTAGGLASFSTAELAPVMHFGIFGPIGVLFAFAFTVVLLPALLAVVPLRDASPRAGRPQQEDAWDRWILRCGATAARRPGAVLVAAGLCLAVAIAGATRLRFSWDPLSWLPDSEPIRVATEILDREMGGSSSFEVLIETGVENGLHDPGLLARLDALRADLASFQLDGTTVSKTVSLADVLKEIHQALNENRPEYYAIPKDRRLVAQEFLLFENTGADDLEDVVDTQFRLASFTVRIPQGDAMRQVPVLDAIDARFREVLGDAATVTMTGGLVLGDRSFFAMIRSMAASYVLALLIVTPLMILMLGSLRGGLLSMIPNITPIVLTLGLMGWLGVPIDFSTMMSGAIVLGIAVDDTIHFAHNFQRFYARGDDPSVAVRRSLETAGRAMLFTSIVLAAAFLIYAFSTLDNLFNLGVFTAFAVVTAFLADVLVAPALMVLFQRRPRHSPAAAAAGATGR
ncbi:MAG: MMPL family transporter [Myxococcales bacterium]|nr:MMPL family transporter [Myxococcales bacterium]